MKIDRVWAMPNSATFSIKPIHDLLLREVKSGIVLDPFARDSTEFSTITNDLNPDYETDYHLDALDFLKQFPDNYADTILYDPPYSLRQVSEVYHSVGVEVTQETTQSSWRRKHLDEIQRVLKQGGKCVSFGWNSSGVGKTRGFRLDRILLVPHGGSHNDTIVTVETKIK